MNGRELIVYILENGLEDEPMIKDGVLVGFMTRAQAASKFDVGTATVEVWLSLGLLDYIDLNDRVMIPVNTEKPKN